ncbi:hypothetical protein [Mesorhizobium sp. M8A.F.Ca.ET.165.01.1.1]|uniref:hypothetical protein n=1 Tax=Mesorhizobium sp. M8A.F.Ca.ET.165.01.1.1 TaxID=2563960 RepID=UPI001093CA11|nr:hypothetical protein [Mesorhizobium sp. M8A.F.Ca.ET.165.01.1.1]TGT42782.1 hypothetical protein EN808_12940 [Mesorhizobium sp. M8A.F.Ca.ET.165.01.1.1]
MVDNVTGTKQTIVTAPDGTKTVVIDQNLTPEQQQISDNLKQIAQGALDKYTALVNDPLLDSMPEVKAAVNTIYDQEVRGINQNYKGAAAQTEKVAARYGVSDSTASNEQRALNTKNLAGALQGADADKVNLTNQYRQQEMANQLQAYGLASGRQDTLISQGLQTLGLGNQSALQAASNANAFNSNLYNTQVQLYNQQQANKASGLGTLGTLAGLGLTYATGGLGGFAASGLGAGWSSSLAGANAIAGRNGIMWN